MRVEHIGDATLILADCMDIMRDMPDKAFDLAIVDPPYGDGGGELAGQEAVKVRRTVRQVQHRGVNHAYGGRFERYAPPRKYRGRGEHGRRNIRPKGVALAIFDIGTLRRRQSTSMSFSACRNIRLFGAEITSLFRPRGTSLCGEN